MRSLCAGGADGKHKRHSAPGESFVNGFSDAGSIPAASIEKKHLLSTRQKVLFSTKSVLADGINPTSEG